MVYNKIDDTRCCISLILLTRQKSLKLMIGDYFNLAYSVISFVFRDRRSSRMLFRLDLNPNCRHKRFSHTTHHIQGMAHIRGRFEAGDTSNGSAPCQSPLSG